MTGEVVVPELDLVLVRVLERWAGGNVGSAGVAGGAGGGGERTINEADEALERVNRGDDAYVHSVVERLGSDLQSDER